MLGRRAGSASGGFTIIEILIVVVILGLLAAIVMTLFGDSREEARQIAFISDVEIFGNAARVYWVRTGEHVAAADAGVVPVGWESYIDHRKWQRTTPIGGAWDTELDTFGVKSALGVDFANGGGEDQDDTYMSEVDSRFDDGDLATGRFRRLAPGRYYFILMP
ncbi:MAG: prepilin-type N-terminal cleavage/methylation domain-containing protein [Planctomycetes bacterium]|nr:prepilin-type N-terminal cleavage/methylation domain-containing protein [Planctomycetota bacterium]